MYKRIIGGTVCRISMLFPAVLLYLMILDPEGYALAGFAAAAIHECGHLLMLYILRIRPKELTLSFFGMRLILPDDHTMGTTQMMLVALAGPLTNLLFAVLSCIWRTDGILISIHLVLAVLNLLPILPLDGGQAVYSILIRMFTDDIKARKILRLLFWFIWIPLCLLSIALVFHPPHNISLSILCLYVFLMRVFYKEN